MYRTMSIWDPGINVSLIYRGGVLIERVSFIRRAHSINYNIHPPSYYQSPAAAANLISRVVSLHKGKATQPSCSGCCMAAPINCTLAAARPVT